MSSTVPSVCFRIVEIDIKHQRKILTSFIGGGRGGRPLRPHSGCASVFESIKIQESAAASLMMIIGVIETFAICR